MSQLERAKQIHAELVTIYQDLIKERNQNLGPPMMVDSGWYNPNRQEAARYLDCCETLVAEIRLLKQIIADALPGNIEKKLEWIATTMQLKCRKP